MKSAFRQETGRKTSEDNSKPLEKERRKNVSACVRDGSQMPGCPALSQQGEGRTFGAVIQIPSGQMSWEAEPGQESRWLVGPVLQGGRSYSTTLPEQAEASGRVEMNGTYSLGENVLA